jgi:hypothetical protein
VAAGVPSGGAPIQDEFSGDAGGSDDDLPF